MSKSTPAAPDYTGAAQAQAQSSREVTEQQTWANRPTINTPFGQQTWEVTPTWDPSTGQYLNTWTQNTNLTPESQAALNAQMDLQQGRSELAQGLLGRAQQEYGNTMDWSQFDQLAQTPEAGQYSAENLPGFEQLPNVPEYNLQNLPGRGQALQGNDYQAMLQNLPERQQGPQAGQYQGEDIQRQLDTSNLQNVDPSQKYYQNAENAIYGQWENRMAPEFQRQEEGLRAQLNAQGLREGDEAFDREMQKMRQNQQDARTNAQYQATIGAGAEASRMQGMDLSTRGQQFNETQAGGAFANQAAQQALQQQLGIGGQQFSEQLAQGQFGEQQRQAALGEQMGAAQAGFGEQQAQATQADQQRAAALQEQLGTGAQQFQQQMAVAGQGDQRRQQQANEQLAFGQNQFAEQMQAANYQNQLRQQQIAEQMQQRGFSLNEINAILSGQQVSMPSMPGFNAAAASQPVQALQAAQLTGQANLDAFNAQQQATQGTLSGIAGAAMMFSDRRLKKNVTVIGERGDGLKVYSFNYIWEDPERDPEHTGLMAQEVQKLYPRAVIKMHYYLMVDYGKLPDA